MLIAKLPDYDTVLRHFEQPGPNRKVAPFVIAHRLSNAEFTALLELLRTRADPSIYIEDLELCDDGSLQVRDLAHFPFCCCVLTQDLDCGDGVDMAYDCVSAVIAMQMPAALGKAGLPHQAITPAGTGRLTISDDRRPNGNFRPNWSTAEWDQVDFFQQVFPHL